MATSSEESVQSAAIPECVQLTGDWMESCRRAAANNNNNTNTTTAPASSSSSPPTPSKKRPKQQYIQLIPADGCHWYSYGFALRGVLAAQSADGKPHEINVGDRRLRACLHNIAKRSDTRTTLVLEYQNVRFAFIELGRWWPYNMKKRSSEANEAHNRQKLDEAFREILIDKGDLNDRPEEDVWTAEQLGPNDSNNDYSDDDGGDGGMSSDNPASGGGR